MKNISICFVFVLSMMWISGCSLTKKPVIAKPLPETQPLLGTKGHILLKEKLEKSEKVAIVPFAAGVDVPATDQVDWIALQIAKGINDELTTAGNRFTVLSDENAQDADIVIKGRIVNLEEKEGLKLWPKKRKIYLIRVEGMILSADGQEVIAKFSQSEQSHSAEVSFLTLGYHIGQGIGEFLLNGSK